MAMDSVTVAKIIREFFLIDKKMINEISTLQFQFNVILVCLLLLVSY